MFETVQCSRFKVTIHSKKLWIIRTNLSFKQKNATLQLIVRNRKTIASILLLTFLAPALVLVSWHKVKLYETKKQLKWKLAEAVHSSDLVLFKLTQAEANKQLNWEHEKEFEYQGEMYDVVKKETDGDTLFFYCWWDKKETKLNKKLEDLTTLIFQQNPDKQKNEQRILQYYKSLFSLSNRNWNAFQSCSKIEFIAPYVESTQKEYLETPSPPPKVSSSLS